ncbi:unnamed protein product [Urochloa humidicola]
MVRNVATDDLLEPSGFTRRPRVDLLSLPVRVATSSPLVVVPVHTDPAAAAKHGCERGDPRRGYSRGAAASGMLPLHEISCFPCLRRDTT